MSTNTITHERMGESIKKADVKNCCAKCHKLLNLGGWHLAVHYAILSTLLCV